MSVNDFSDHGVDEDQPAAKLDFSGSVSSATTPITGQKLAPAIFEETLKTTLKHAGGPSQFLRKRFQTEEEMRTLVEQMDAILKPNDLVSYHNSRALPIASAGRDANSGSIAIQLKHLSFADGCSPHKFTGLDVAAKLLSEIWLDGFVTNTEPLICVPVSHLPHPDGANGHEIEPFSIGYVKGFHRSCTALFIVAMVIDGGVDLERVNAVLFESLRCVWIVPEFQVFF